VPDYWPIAPGPNEDTYYVLGKPKGADRLAIYLYDLENEVYLERAISHPNVDLESGIVDSKTGKLIGAQFYEDRLGIIALDNRFQEDFDWLNHHFGDEANINVIDTNSDGTKTILFVSGPRFPGEFYYYDVSTRAISGLYASRPRLRKKNLGEMEIVRYRARDGLRLTAYVTHPPGKAGLPAPLIVMPHGGPETRDYFDFDPLVQFLSGRGYRVVQPNFRGSSGYGEKFASAGYGEWGGLMQDDVLDAVQVLIDRNLARKKNICIMGASYGGYSALVGAQNSSELFACAVSISGVTDLVDFVKDSLSEDGKKSGASQYWLESIGDPVIDKAKLISTSPARNAEKFQIPILLLHGEWDWVVPIEQSRKMSKELSRANKQVEFIEVPETGHSYWDNKEEENLYLKLEEFFGEHLTGQ
jgi:dipeptidyl aminopeptidase/acylaminoacyl peptidase